MENETLKNETTTQNIQLVKGKFTPEQASEVMMALLDQKINYHKIEGIQLWEKNHKNDQEPIFKRIKELEAEKQNVTKFISKMRAEGKEIQIKGTLQMSSCD
ncbi:hypothetical protein [Cellulophaga sp. Hel_I_12]|uniref:hypothetical protein n=1 Tax=Cellulophaga sp. Hel_I_12 TaxID=1249972 RepID=UPI0006491434|nr:hypothetical protein [Cellulophaga sp. Hel_I_12]